MSKRNTFNVLSIDSGGISGLSPVLVLAAKLIIALCTLLAYFFLTGCVQSKHGQAPSEIVVTYHDPIAKVPADKPVPDALLLKYTEELLYRVRRKQSELEMPSEVLQKQIVQLLVIEKKLQEAKHLLENYRRTHGYANPVE